MHYKINRCTLLSNFQVKPGNKHIISLDMLKQDKPKFAITFGVKTSALKHF